MHSAYRLALIYVQFKPTIWA